MNKSNKKVNIENNTLTKRVDNAKHGSLSKHKEFIVSE